MGQGPLKGLSVLDLTHHIAGPFCTKLLADYGATVTKIERPGSGDPARRVGPFPKDQPNPEASGLFLYLNTNKQGITLDLKTGTGKRLFLDLVAKTDVLVENFEPRVMAGLGLTYETLRSLNPSLIMTSISNFGQSGPYRDWRAEELTLFAMSGFMIMTGEPDREPVKTGGSQAQFQAGLAAAGATLTAALARRRNGKGQRVDVSIWEAVANNLGASFILYTKYGISPRRSGIRQNTRHPQGLFRCRDGFVTIVAVREDNYEALVEMTGLHELRQEKFDSALKRCKHAEEFDSILSRYLMTHDKAEILREGQARRIPVGVVLTAEDLLRDPHYKARDFFVQIEHPETGTFPYPSTPLRWSTTPWQAGRAPLLGEHNEEVYCGLLGVARDELVRLKAQGVI